MGQDCFRGPRLLQGSKVASGALGCFRGPRLLKPMPYDFRESKPGNPIFKVPYRVCTWPSTPYIPVSDTRAVFVNTKNMENTKNDYKSFLVVQRKDAPGFR